MTIWREDYIKVNKYTRPSIKLVGVKGIVVHYTATPNATAKNERDYFNGTCVEQKRYASAHLFVDKNEAVLIMPLNEVAYHANDRTLKVSALRATAFYYRGGNANLNTIGVEMCVEKDGSIHKDTLARTIKVVAELCKMYKLNENNLYRHYDVTGKLCPLSFVESPKQWVDFKASVKEGVRVPVKVSKPSPSKVTPTPVKPVTSTPKATDLGTIEVLVDSLWFYDKADWDAKKDMVKKGDIFTVVALVTVSGSKMYKLKSGNYISANTKYVRFKKK